MTWRYNPSQPTRLFARYASLLLSLFVPLAQMHAQTQAGMNAQGRAEFEQADAELNKTYEAFLKKLPNAESKEKLKGKPASMAGLSRC